MSENTPALPQDVATATALGQELGLDVRRVYERIGEGWLIHAYWHGAPVAISVRGGIAGGVGVAFWTGGADESTEDADTDYPDQWDEILDTSFAGVDAAVILGAAALKHYGQERAQQYQHVPLPPPSQPS